MGMADKMEREKWEPVSRGRMRHISEVLLGPNTAQFADNSDKDGDGTEVNGKDEGYDIEEETQPKTKATARFGVQVLPRD